MIPVESQALAEVMFGYAVLMLIFAIGVRIICHIYDCVEETPEEQAQHEAERIAKELERQAKEIHRKQMRSVRFWNF